VAYLILEYLNPELAEKHNEKARGAFNTGDFPAAIIEYEVIY